MKAKKMMLKLMGLRLRKKQRQRKLDRKLLELYQNLARKQKLQRAAIA